jgi:thioredoxin 1
MVVAVAVVYYTMSAGIFRSAPPGEPSLSLPTNRQSENQPLNSEQSRVQHADEDTFATMVLKSDIPVLVDFYADWCGPCQRLAPVLERLAAENPGAKIVKVNVDSSPKLADQYGVSAIPSLKLFKNGLVIGELVGLASKTELEMLLRR